MRTEDEYMIVHLLITVESSSKSRLEKKWMFRRKNDNKPQQTHVIKLLKNICLIWKKI